MIQTQLVDPVDGQAARITGEGALSVVIHPHPPRDETLTLLPFRQRFTQDGTATGTSNMNVDGSTTAVDYYIGASPSYEIYIKAISVRIGDTGTVSLNRFGALTALTNGVDWEWQSQQEGTIVLHDGIKTNLEFVRLGQKTAGIGATTNAFQADISGAGETTYLPQIDLAGLFGLQYGIQLRRGTTDKLIFRVNDNLTGLTTFDAIAYGSTLDGVLFGS